MRKVSHRATVVIICLSLLYIPTKLNAQKKGSDVDRASARPSVDIENLMENQDVLFEISAGHTKDIRALEQRVLELEKKLAEATEQGEELKKMREEMEKLRTQPTGAEKKTQERSVLEPKFELRVRPEFTQNLRDLNSDVNDKDWQYLQRLRLGLALTPIKDFSAVVVFQDSRLWGEELSTLPGRNEITTKTFLHEGYVQVDNILTPGLGFQAGRMQLRFGAERQVGAVDWHNVGRAFDGLRIFYKKPNAFSISAFFTMVSDRGRESGPNTDFGGVYASLDLWKFLAVEVYGFYLYNDEPSGTEHIGTVGLRAVAKPLKSLEIEGEGAWQFGRSLLDKQQGVKDHVAAAYFAKVSYDFTDFTKVKPSLGAFFYSASGDPNPQDSRNVAYRVLYPTGHPMLGFMDLFQWTGILDFGPALKLGFLKDFSFSLDYHAFFLTSDGGILRGAFRADTVIFPSGKGRFVGHEMDVVLSWRAHRYLSFETGYSFFKPGSVTSKSTSIDRQIEEHLGLGADVAHFFYFQGKVSF